MLSNYPTLLYWQILDTFLIIFAISAEFVITLSLDTIEAWICRILDFDALSWLWKNSLLSNYTQVFFRALKAFNYALYLVWMAFKICLHLLKIETIVPWWVLYAKSGSYLWFSCEFLIFYEPHSSEQPYFIPGFWNILRNILEYTGIFCLIRVATLWNGTMSMVLILSGWHLPAS